MSYLIAGLLLAAPSADPTKVEWHWLHEPAICGLRQTIDEAGAVLQISRIPGRGDTMIMLQDRRAETREWKPLGAATLTLEPGNSIAADSFLGPGESPGSRAVSVTVSDQADLLDKLSRATSVTLSQADVGSLRAVVRSPAAAIQSIRACEDKTLREWGFDPAALQALRAPPSPVNSLVDWFRSDDYPRIAAIYGVGGFVVAVLDVGADGKPQACKVVNRPRLTDFRDAVCEALKGRARFHPALDVGGRPISAPYVVRVRFQPNR